MKFIFDLDGTICFKGQPISNEILQALTEVDEAGIEVIFASARPIRDMLPVIHEKLHHYTMIGGNGSLISKKGKVIKSSSFSVNEIQKLKNLITQYNATYLIDGQWNYAYTGPDEHPILQNLDPGNLAEMVSFESLDPVVKVLILTSNHMEEFAQKLSLLNVFVNKHSNENTLDISPSGINKWSALKALEIEEHTYIAFGNDANDISMFEKALHTVMIGYNDSLAPFTKEAISLSGNFEEDIAEKIRTLSKQYSTISV